ncbi:autotransporter domain-containing protein [Mesorhizobium sp. BAC0120]|uniref:autotransporter domain-containing protein n=1 Tax=Mesorhizobium sp. BAC0120 TaxID=3090670 RepID=UPI00298D2C96|nr:autotransporter domain-containing protein [Mesorhizobium sp. BAC0120]MDW6025396.1 autotransporter domain-containing protein [Mesorhizobium sp. BAC0120]
MAKTLAAGVSTLSLVLCCQPARSQDQSFAQPSIYWDGGDPDSHNNDVVDGGSGVWTAGLGPLDSNWTDQTGASNGGYNLNPSFAVFQGAAGTVRVDDTAGAVGVTGMHFASDGYRIEGDPLTLHGQNNATVIRVGDGTAAGASMTATIGAVLSGNSSLVKDDLGTLALAGTNTYTGGTVIRSGTVRILNDRALGSGPINMLAGTALSFATSPWQTMGAVDLGGDVTFEVDQYRNASLNRTISGAGGFAKTGLGTLSLYGDNSFAGDVHVRQGRLWVDNWAAQPNRAIADTARVTVDAGAVIAFQKAETIGELAGAGVVDITYAGDLGLTVGATDRDFTFAGNISGGDPARPGFPPLYGLTKTGSGTFTLTGTSDSQQAVLVSGGALAVDGSIASGLVDVGTGGTLSGHGSIAGTVQIYGGGTLHGRSGETLSIGGNLSLAPSSVVDVSLGLPGNAALFSVGGDLTLDGKLNVSDAGGFGAGVYRLIDYRGTLIDHGLDIGTKPAGVGADSLSVQTAVTNQVNLVSSAGATLGFWDGADASMHDNGRVDGGSGSWRADGRNWTDQSGMVNGRFKPNPTFAVFQGASGTVTVDDDAGALGVSGMQFASNGYRIEGDPLALQGTNGVTIIRVGDGTAAGVSMTATIASSLSGVSALVKDDLGTLVITGANTHSSGTELRAGILQVSADNNLGAASGGLTFSGGTLATTASFDTSRAIMLTRGGSVNVAASTELGLSGTISGSGDLVKLGNGVLRLDNTGNGYGNTLVEAGTLVGNASSIRGDIGNAGTVVFEQAADGSFAGDILGLNGTRGAMIKKGAGVLKLGGISNLDWSVEAGGLISATDRFTGDVTLAAGSSFVFDQAYAGVYAGMISGSGSLSFIGGGAVQLTGDSSGFTGLSTVTDAVLRVDEVLGGSTIIGAGGLLHGTGIIGSGAGSVITVAAGGTLAPGNSIGTLTVNGDLIIEKGSHFAVEVDPQGTTSDLVHVTGNATLDGGLVVHVGYPGRYGLHSSYTILSADGKLTGRFDNATSAYAFVTPDLAYDYGAGTVSLELVHNNRDFASMAETRNQRATATGIESIGFDAGDAVYDAIALLPDDTNLIRQSFDQLSGEIYASATTALIDDSRFVRETATDRIRAAFGDVGASSAPVTVYDDKRARTADPTDDGLAIWGQGFGSWGQLDGDGNAGNLSHDTGGFLVGVDAPVFDTWRLGVLGGYSRSSFSARDRASSGDSDNYHLGLYGGTQSGNLGLRAGLAYTWQDISTSRTIAFPGFSDRLASGYRAGTFQAFGDLGYRLDASLASFEPFANLAHVSLHTDGFTEQGGAAALHGDGQTTNTTFSTLGLRAATNFDLGGVAMTARGLLGWRHAFGDLTPLSTQALSVGDAFTIAGVPIAEDAAVIEAGLDFKPAPTTILGLSYSGQIAQDARQHGFRADFNVRF